MHFDVLILGAGLSGITAAYHLQSRCPRKSYAILEARERLGGTWDLFQYPGIRCDSDIYTYGFSFRPFRGKKVLVDGPTILEYLRSTAEMFGILPNIRFSEKVEHASFSTADARWTVEVRRLGSGEKLRYTCNFLYACCGYYDYEQGYTPEFPGRERFLGRIVHPQKWTPDIEYKDKRVIVIGSGATAVTLVPALAKEAAQVTMLQRTPSYIFSVPAIDPIARALEKWLPESTLSTIVRWKNIVLSSLFYQFCRRFPERATRFLLAEVKRAGGPATRIEPDFTPPYKPWDQRLCLVPDNDIFVALREGKANVVTGQIETFTKTGIRLQSGKELPADLIVTATGLNVTFQGGIKLSVDGTPVDVTRRLIYRGMMLSDVPNFALTLGYTNASWTLKADLTAQLVCRVLHHLDKRKLAIVYPRQSDSTLPSTPVFNLMSGYVQRAAGALPRQGPALPWKVYQNYVRDLLLLRYSRLNDGVLTWLPKPPSQTPARRSV